MASPAVLVLVHPGEEIHGLLVVVPHRQLAENVVQLLHGTGHGEGREVAPALKVPDSEESAIPLDGGYPGRWA